MSCKTISKSINAVINRHLGHGFKLYRIVKVNVNKVTFDIYESSAYDQSGQISICTKNDKIGDSITLKAADDVIDELVNNFHEIILMPVHHAGIVMSIVTFEEINMSSPEEVDEFLSGILEN